MKILFVSPWYPVPPDNGAKLRISNLLATLCTRHRVTLIAAHDPAVPPPLVWEGPLSACEKVIPVPWSPQPVKGVARLLSFIWPKPAWVFFAPSPEMQAAIAQEVQLGSYNLIITYELSTLGYTSAWGQVPVVLEDVELGSYVAGPEAQNFTVRARKRLFAWKLRRALQQIMPRIAGCTVPSMTEYELLRQMVPAGPAVEIIENCLDGARYAGWTASPKPQTLIFTGALTFRANYEAVSHFLAEIYPLIKKELPDARFCITGKHDGVTLPLAAQDPSVTIAGFVEDVRPLIASSWVSVVPLLTGGGTRFKILEALALGAPVVSTSKGAEGLEVVAGEHLLIADSPADFAAAVVKLCRDHTLHARLSEAGRRFVLEHHTWEGVAPRYLALVERVAQGHATV